MSSITCTAARKMRNSYHNNSDKTTLCHGGPGTSVNHFGLNGLLLHN